MDKRYSAEASDFIVDAPAAAAILAESFVTLRVHVEALLRKDSLALTDQDRALIRARVVAAPCPRVIITHGTDTMPQTGRALSDIPGKTIVLTGAMQPAAFKHSDAHFNLGAAVAAVQTLPPGVYIAMNGRILDPQAVTKNVAENRYDPVT